MNGTTTYVFDKNNFPISQKDFLRALYEFYTHAVSPSTTIGYAANHLVSVTTNDPLVPVIMESIGLRIHKDVREENADEGAHVSVNKARRRPAKARK